MTSVAVREFPKCVCGKDARYRCRICERTFCSRQGCPSNGEHHPATVDVVVMIPLGGGHGDQR